MTSEFGQLTLDIAYGGAFYGILPITSVGLNWNSPITKIVETATAIKKKLIKQVPIMSKLDFNYKSPLLFWPDI